MRGLQPASTVEKLGEALGREPHLPGGRLQATRVEPVGGYCCLGHRLKRPADTRPRACKRRSGPWTPRDTSRPACVPPGPVRAAPGGLSGVDFRRTSVCTAPSLPFSALRPGFVIALRRRCGGLRPLRCREKRRRRCEQPRDLLPGQRRVTLSCRTSCTGNPRVRFSSSRAALSASRVLPAADNLDDPFRRGWFALAQDFERVRVHPIERRHLGPVPDPPRDILLLHMLRRRTLHRSATAMRLRHLLPRRGAMRGAGAIATRRSLRPRRRWRRRPFGLPIVKLLSEMCRGCAAVRFVRFVRFGRCSDVRTAPDRCPNVRTVYKTVGFGRRTQVPGHGR